MQASTLKALAPKPYTVSVGNATKLPYYIYWTHFYKFSSVFSNMIA